MRRLLLSVILLVGLLLFWLYRSQSDPRVQEDLSESSNLIRQEGQSDNVSTTPTLIAGASLAENLNAPDTSVLEDMEVVSGLFVRYRRVFGGNPTGENDEITAALTGKNPKHAAVLPPGHSAIQNGQLVDRWGTPYFFHSLSAMQTDIRSAGPDRQLWTGDDVLSEP